MPYPNTDVLNIVIPQTSASKDGSQAPFVERIISGSRLILQTDTTGTLIGSSDLNVNNITASNISASGYISASALRVETSIVDGGTLTVIGATTLAGLTGTTATFSGLVSASAGLTASAIQDDGTLTVVGNSILSNVFATNITASNISASGFVSASAIFDTGTLTVLGNSILSNVTASNISASGNISSSNLWVQNSIVDNGTLTVLGNTILANLTASNISASKIVASEITASSELFVGTGTAYRTYGEASVPENLARLYVSGSATIFSKYATLNLATSASDAGAQSSILFSRLASSGAEAVLSPRMQLGTESGSTDLRIYGYYSSTDPDIFNQAAGANIVAGTRAIFKQSGYFGVGNFISYGAAGGATTTYVSSLPGYAGIVGPDAMLTILPMDSASFGSAGSKQYNRNILNIMSYDTSSIMFISGSDGYVLLGKNTTDGINRLQVAGNVSASAYTGSSAIITNLIATNITSSNISASGNISSSTLTVVGNSTLSNVFATNITASNISASGQIIASSFTGSLLGTSSWANVSLSSSVDKINDNSTYYVTFVNNTGSSALKADADILSYNPLLNRVIIGNTSGSLFISNDSGTNPNSIALFNSNDNQGSIIQIGSPSTNATASLYVGNQSNGFRVLTGQGNNTGVVTELTTKITNATNATSYDSTTAALQVDGGARISKDTWISGSLNVAGDFTVFGSSSVVYISSSTVIINDNIIQLNAYFPYERYAGFEVFDSGSNQRSASLLWDGQNDNWITVDQNNSSSNIIIGPTASFGSPIQGLTVNRLTKAYEGNAISDSALSDDGTTLRYTGTTISSSIITATTGSITYITGALVTYVTGSFTTITIATGSNPGPGNVAVPQHPTASGMPGQINVDNNFVYVYTNNIWKRVPLSTWSL